MPTKSSNLQRIIFVTETFPPSRIAGVPRVRAMMQYLPTHGFLPHVITTNEHPPYAELNPDIEVHRLPYKELRRSEGKHSARPIPVWRRVIRDVVALPDRYCWWAKLAAKKAWQLARKYQAPVFVSAPPVSTAWMVARYRQQNDPPLFIDFRDAWIHDPIRADYYRNPLRTFMERRMERTTLAQASLCFCATPGIMRDFQTTYPQWSDRFRVLLNGFDEPDWTNLSPVSSLGAQGLNIVYSGSFPGYRTPETILQALAELNDPDIRLYFVGESSGKAEYLLNNKFSQLKDRVFLHPRQEYAAGLSWQCSADVLLLIITPGPRGDESHQEMTSKMYEYLRAGRPLLATIPPGGDADVLLSQFPWVIRNSPFDVEGIKRALVELKRTKGAGKFPSEDVILSAIRDLRRDVQVQSMATILHEELRTQVNSAGPRLLASA